KEYNKLKKEKNLSTQALEVVRDLRASLDQRGGVASWLLIVGERSFANKTMCRAELDRPHLLARCRKDARLCFRAPEGGRRKYAQQLFTPDGVRTQEDRSWNRARVYLEGKRRMVRYKDVKDVLWKRGAGTMLLRLIVIAPVPYKLSKNSHKNYREPAYFLTTDLKTSIKLLVQSCFDRWQIEVNHRDEKDILGVGQAQVRSAQSIPRHPALAVASYSLLLLAALKSFGPGRSEDYLNHPKWRTKRSKRASFLDIVSKLRSDIDEASVSHLLPQHFAKNLAIYEIG